jgi:hypothetical protein
MIRIITNGLADSKRSKKMTVYCEKCGRIIGNARTFSYGGPNNDNHEDYGETEPNEFYGGEYYGEEYCSDCLCAIETAEEAEG